MSTIRMMALLVGLASLVGSVLSVRGGDRFPLRTLSRVWLGAKPTRGNVVVGIMAGFGSVLVIPLVALPLGLIRINLTLPITLTWLGLAGASVAIKATLVVFEEAIYRGSLCSELLRVMPATLVVIFSALVFSGAHAGRSWLGLAILCVDGIGFAAAFLILKSLWVPLIWHLSKNIAVWTLYGAGTLQLTPGPFRVEHLDPSWFLGSASGPGLGDLLVTSIVVGVVVVQLKRTDSLHASAS